MQEYELSIFFGEELRQNNELDKMKVENNLLEIEVQRPRYVKMFYLRSMRDK
jgi:hypothetical protein